MAQNWFSKLAGSIPFIGKRQTPIVRVKTRKVKSQPVKVDEAHIKDPSPEDRILLGAVKSQMMLEYTRGLQELQGDMTTLFTQAVQDRRSYLETADELKRYSIARRILKILTTEILKPDDKGEILEICSQNPELDAELKKFHREQNLDNLLRMITPDILNLGEYTLRVHIEENQGIVDISDTVDQLGIVAFYDRGVPSCYLVLRRDNYYLEPPTNYSHFVIGEEKLRLALNDVLQRNYIVDYDKLPPELQSKIPEFVRVGEPIFFSVVEKIRQLQILEQVVIATKLANITQRKLVALQVPASMPVDKVMEACQKFEEMLNSQTGVDTDSELITVSEIMSSAGRYTVIPNYSDDKGALTALDVRNDPQVDDIIHAITDFREVLLTSVGIPYKLVFGSRGGNENQPDRQDDIRIYAMFSNLISEIQTSLRSGLISLCMMHLRNRGYDCTSQDFDVFFKNASVNIGDLEKLEYDDAKQEMVGRKIEFIEKMQQNPLLNAALSEEGVFEWLETAFDDLTNGIPLFKPEYTQEEPEDTTWDDPQVASVTPLNRADVLTRVRDGFRSRLKARKNQKIKADVLSQVRDGFQSRLKARQSNGNGSLSSKSEKLAEDISDNENVSDRRGTDEQQ